MKYEKHTCEKCGKEFLSLGRYKYCPRCRLYEKQRTDKCARCGKEFTTTSDETIYCRNCRSLARWKKDRVVTACTVCHKEFKAMFDETVCPKCRAALRRTERNSNRKCLMCGGPLKSNKLQLCAACKEKSNSIESECVVCGKKFFPKRKHEQCKTCSRTCQGYYIQQMGYGMKYNTDELHAKVIEHIKQYGAPLSIDDLGRDMGGITRKVFSARHWTVKSLLTDAGIYEDWLTKGTSLFERSVYFIIREVVGQNCTIETQKVFNDLKGVKGGAARFDFYIPDYNLVIEADGRQHYTDDDPWRTEELVANDKLKNEYCLNNGIGLLRIRYKRYESNRENIKNVLIKLLPPNGEIRPVNCFNCWNGSELVPIPISNQASDQEEGSQTIP